MYIFCFWSLLVARQIVKEMVVSFMIVGHTHDDIDASFGWWSMELRGKDHPTLSLLMLPYMSMEEAPFIPHLIKEVPDFKAYVRPYIGMNKKQLVDHSSGRQYKLFVDDNEWPIMQYKRAYTDTQWLPKAGLKLWKEDAEHKSMLPQGDPLCMKPHKIKNRVEIARGLDRYIEHWTDISNEDDTAAYKAHMSHLVTYWMEVRNAMCNTVEEDVVDSEELRHGFWPCTQ